jgi:integrase
MSLATFRRMCLTGLLFLCPAKVSEVFALRRSDLDFEKRAEEQVCFVLPASVSQGTMRSRVNALRFTLSGTWAASEMIENGVAPSVVQRQMRHSDSRITLQEYAHVIGDAQRRAVDSLAGRVLELTR